MKRREFNERQQARLTTRILTNSRIFRHARVLVIYKESLPGLLARNNLKPTGAVLSLLALWLHGSSSWPTLTNDGFGKPHQNR